MGKKEKKVHRFKARFKNLCFLSNDIEFKNFMYETQDESEIKFLKEQNGIEEVREEEVAEE